MTPGGKYTRLLSPGAVALNNGTTTGGLAYALQQGLQGMIAGDERRAESDRKKGLAEALKAMMPGTMAPGQNPAAGPGMMAAAPAAQPNPRQAAITQLAQTDPELAFQMVNSDYAAEQDRKGREQALADQKAFFDYKANNPGPTDAQRSAAAMGLQPGTPEYSAYLREATLTNTAAPSPVREWEYFSSLSPEAQKQYLIMKRSAPSPYDLGDRRVPVDPRTGLPMQTGYMIGTPPDQTINDGRVVTMSGVPGGAPVEAPKMMMGGGGVPAQGGAMPAPGGVSVEELPKSSADLDAERVRAEQEARAADTVVQDIDRAFALIDGEGLPSTGWVGGHLSGVGGTSANNLRALLDTIKANVGFDRLQQMRNASKTGGALGAINEQEMNLLQSVMGSLDQSQSAEQLKKNLERVRNVYLDIIHGKGTRPGRGGGAPSKMRMKFDANGNLIQ